ncbi:MAG: M23 family metallopeptidase, partial [Leptospiraceae bacterium]|nr:M23 family metallopeptidase [Leptospiraceae bacterium]
MFKNIFLLIFVVLFLFIQPIFPGKENGGNKQSSAKTYYYKDSHFQIYLKARKFKKGEVMALILKANPRSQNFSPHLLRIKWSKKWYRLHKLGSQYISFLPISPGIRPEKHILELDYGTGDLSFHKEFKVPVEKQHYKRSSFKNKRKIARLKTPKKFNQGFSKKTLAFIRHCTELKNQAFRSKEKLHLEGDFKYPLKSTFITSSYNAVRAYSSRNVKAHKGVDFRGKKGTPIYAIEAGKVVLSKK